jgi:hypothetical protein
MVSNASDDLPLPLRPVNQLVARDIQREVFEIMLTRTADLDEFLAHRAKIPESNNR